MGRLIDHRIQFGVAVAALCSITPLFAQPNAAGGSPANKPWKAVADEEYRVVVKSSAFVAEVGPAGLRVTSKRNEDLSEDEGWSLGLRTLSIGREGSAVLAARGMVYAEGDRVSLHREGWRE